MSTEPCVSHKVIVLDASRQRTLNEFFVPSSASKTLPKGPPVYARKMTPSEAVGSIGMKHSRLKSSLVHAKTF